MGAELEEPAAKRAKVEENAEGTGEEAGKVDKEKREKKDKKEKKEKKDKKLKKDGKDKKDKKDKKEKKEKKDKKDKKGKKDKKNKKNKNIVVKKGNLKRVKGMMKKKVAQQKAQQKPSKVIAKTEDDYEPVNRWWEQEDGAAAGKRGAKKWDTFEHHGLMFSEDYVPHGICIKYAGEEVRLTPAQEEVANFWTSVKGSEYEKKEVFIKNFWAAFTSKFPEDTHIKDFNKCDFNDIWEHREQERQARLNRTKEEKDEASKKEKEGSYLFSHALINGVRERIGNFKLEPPQLFRGRGEHPKQGMLKKRTFSEAITINIGPDACVPRVLGLPGHAWKDVVHENTVTWIANFEDSITLDSKYVLFAANSGIKGQPDLLKYDRARRLVSTIGKIRESYTKLQTSQHLVDRQKATATYFIDRLALRVGGEKDTEEEADTVGCCSLRCEHLTLEPPDTISFDFLGKDSIRYQNTVVVTEQVFHNIDMFMKDKKPEENVFDKVTPTVLNDYFKDFMDDLSAKVFRTYNASYTLQKELLKFPMEKIHHYSQDDLVKYYNDANREVAVLCNHQKAVSKNHAESMDKMNAVKAKMEKDCKTLRKHLSSLNDPHNEKLKVKGEDAAKLPSNAASCKKKISEAKMRLEKHVKQMELKEDNKTVSLGTSKMNYMDPRITVAWCKKVDLSIERVFPRTVRSKFPWAMHFPSSYVFE